MAAGFQTWTVLPHAPIEELAPNVWRVEGVLSAWNKRVMILVRLGDGRILMHNPIALDEPSMARIDAWGEVAAILVPNAFHRQDAFIMQGRYPKAKVYAPSGAVARASKATPCAGSYADVPTDASVSLREIDGIGKREGVVLVRSEDGLSAVYCDTLLNIPKLSGVLGVLLYPTGTLSVPRPTKLVFARDRKALRADLESVAAKPDLVRVIPGHGAVVAADARAKLREAAARL
ncbi:MAG TPA: hypothetical protein VGM06_06295 [Polyangiaceae bacterium]|jgi:hypothetical protein